MNNVTIQVSPLKIAIVLTGIIALVLGGLTLYISDVLSDRVYIGSINNFLYSFLTLGTRPIRLSQIENFAYLWFGLGTVLILAGLFFKSNRSDRESLLESESLTPEQRQALNDDVFRDIGNTVKSAFTSAKINTRK
jgi:hypothetical protein